VQNLADTSDTTYEKRHRKYETFEKRQRLREKEKLKHEQYKLKERIEQLRGMDGSAFLTLPASLFCSSGTSAPQEGDGSTDEPTTVGNVADTGLQALPGIHVNGAALHNEGERRRVEILETAAGLEERYRVLLPPDKVVKELTGASAGGSRRPSASMEPEEVMEEAAPLSQPLQKLKLRIKFPPHGSPSANGNGNGVLPKSVPAQSRAQTQSQIQEPGHSPRRVNTRAVGAAPTTPLPSGTKSKTRTSITESPSVADLESPRPSKRQRRRAHAQEVEDEEFVGSDAGEEVELPSPVSVTTPRKAHHSHPTHNQPVGTLMATALRTSSLSSNRKAQRTQRHLTAFGLKIHPEVEEIRDFEIPYWLKEERLEMLMNQEPEGEFGQFGGVGGFAESVNGHENSVRASASDLGSGSMGGGEGIEASRGGDETQPGFGSLDVDVGSAIGMRTSQPSEVVSTSEPAEMEMLL
jgi:hypothetical protein